MMKSLMKRSALLLLAGVLAVCAAGGALADDVYTPQYEDEIEAYAYMMECAAEARLLEDDEMGYRVQGTGAVVYDILPHDMDELTTLDPISVRLPDTVDGHPIVGFELPTELMRRGYVVELVILPDTVQDVSQEQGTHTAVDFVIVSEQNPYLTTVMGAVYDKERTQLLWANLQDTFTLRILQGVTSIRDYGLNNDFGSVDFNKIKEIKADPVQSAAIIQGGMYYFMNDVWLPASLTDVGRQYQFNRIIFKVADDNPVYAASENGCLLSKADMGLLTINYYYIQAVTVANRIVTIPEGTKILGCDVLSFSMDELIIPASVTSICFDDYYWRDVYYAYTVDPGNEVYASVDGVLYSKDMKTLIAYPAYRNTADNTYTVLDGVERIAQDAFISAVHESDNTLLHTVIVPESVVTIERQAFHLFDDIVDCYSVYVPAAAADVASSAFWGDMTVYTPEGSAAWDAAVEFMENNPQSGMTVIAD